MLNKMAEHSTEVEDEAFMLFKMGSRGAYRHAMYSKVAHNLKRAVYKWTASTMLGYHRADKVTGSAVSLRANRMDSDYL